MNRPRIAAAATAAALALPLAAVAAAPASAATVSSYTLHISCSAANIRSGPGTGYVALGVGYRGDKDVVNAETLGSNGLPTWYRGTVTRAPDGRKVSGFVTASCLGY